jgi:CRISPR-associated protein Cas2
VKTFVIYDVEDDRVRTKVADACQDYGLVRIQFSTFFGDLSRNRQEELQQRIGRLIGKKAAYVVLLPICQRDMEAMLEVGAPLRRLPLLM